MAECLCPVLVKNENRRTQQQYRVHKVGCGKCPPCVKKRVSHWQYRLENQQKSSLSSAFITFTYEDKALPLTPEGVPTLHKKDFQDFMKRLRKKDTKLKLDNGHWKWKYYIDKDGKEKRRRIPKDPLKYYAVGEYGTKTYRPHYHAIMFNIPHSMLRDYNSIYSIWQKGQIQIDPCTAASIGYVTGYVMKRGQDGKYTHFENVYDVYKKRYIQKLKVSSKNPEDPREQEFSIMSKKMGADYLTPQMINYHKQKLRNYVTKENGVKIALPRYYKEKIFNEEELGKISREYHESLEYANDLQPSERVKLTMDEMEFERVALERTQDAFEKQSRKVQRYRAKI